MRKIPTLFKKLYDSKDKFIGVSYEFTNDICEEAFKHGVPTVKFDGSACAIINGKLYKRYDYRGKGVLPDGAIPCQSHEDLPGHFPVWIPCNPKAGEDKWFFAAYYNTPVKLSDGSYEAIGKHFNGNYYNIDYDVLVKHGRYKIYGVELKSYEAIEQYLKEHNIEGIVWWYGGKPVCKIRRKDFFIKWPDRQLEPVLYDILGK